MTIPVTRSRNTLMVKQILIFSEMSPQNSLQLFAFVWAHFRTLSNLFDQQSIARPCNRDSHYRDLGCSQTIRQISKSYIYFHVSKSIMQGFEIVIVIIQFNLFKCFDINMCTLLITKNTGRNKKTYFFTVVSSTVTPETDHCQHPVKRLTFNGPIYVFTVKFQRLKKCHPNHVSGYAIQII